MIDKKTVKSHSEEQVVKGCIELMWDLVSRFEDYLDYLDIDYTEIPEEERFEVRYSNFEIVNKLFLSTTTHSGGTSTRQKCKELGLDSADNVVFSIPTYE